MSFIPLGSPYGSSSNYCLCSWRRGLRSAQVQDLPINYCRDSVHGGSRLRQRPKSQEIGFRSTISMRTTPSVWRNSRHCTQRLSRRCSFFSTGWWLRGKDIDWESFPNCLYNQILRDFAITKGRTQLVYRRYFLGGKVVRFSPRLVCSLLREIVVRITDRKFQDFAAAKW